MRFRNAVPPDTPSDTNILDITTNIIISYVACLRRGNQVDNGFLVRCCRQHQGLKGRGISTTLHTFKGVPSSSPPPSQQKHSCSRAG